MYKRLFLSVSFVCVLTNIFSQEVTKDDAEKVQAEIDKLKSIAADTVKPWKIGGVISFNGQQVSLTNWAAGGNNSISVGGLVNVFAKYKKGKTTWDNNLELGYGVIKQGTNNKWWKNDDKIQFSIFDKQTTLLLFESYFLMVLNEFIRLASSIKTIKGTKDQEEDEDILQTVDNFEDNEPLDIIQRGDIKNLKNKIDKVKINLQLKKTLEVEELIKIF